MSRACLLLLAACGRLGFGAGEDDAQDDARPLDGLTDDGTLLVDAAPFTFPPSSGVLVDHLTGVTAALVVDDGWLVNTDTGEIRAGATTVRAAGTGVIAGIRFERLSPSIGLFAATRLDVQDGRELRGFGTRALVIAVATDATIAGIIDVDGGLCPDGTADPTCGGPGGGDGGRTTALAAGCGPGGRGRDSGTTGGGGGGYGTAGGRGGHQLGSGGGIGGTTAG